MSYHNNPRHDPFKDDLTITKCENCGEEIIGKYHFPFLRGCRSCLWGYKDPPSKCRECKHMDWMNMLLPVVEARRKRYYCKASQSNKSLIHDIDIGRPAFCIYVQDGEKVNWQENK